jgi:hypothetical protein
MTGRSVNWEELWEQDPVEAGKLQHRLRMQSRPAGLTGALTRGQD